MRVEDFISAQRRLIAEGGFGDYLPTLWVETPRHVKVNVLTDAPDGSELEQLARDWAGQLGRTHDYFLAFRADDSHIKVVARVGAVTSEEDVPIGAGA